MSTRTDPKTQLYQWLARWEFLTQWEKGVDPATLTRSDELDVFVKNPSEGKLRALVSSLKERSDSKLFTGKFRRSRAKKENKFNVATVLEGIVDYLWLKNRAERLGISIEDVAPPEVFYILNTASRREFSLLAPAPADITDVPFRAGMAESLFGLLSGKKKRGRKASLPPEKIVLVFTQVGEELRRAVVPQLVSRLDAKNTPHLYLRMAPRTSSRLDVEPTEGTGIIPVDHRDLLKRRVGEIREGSILGESAGGGVLVLDFLDSHDWLHTGPARWLPTHERLIDAINSSFIRRDDSRLLIFLSGEPNSYRKGWLMFSPFFKKLDVDQPSVAGLGMVPQLMNESQGADLMGFGPQSMRLIASRVPLIFGILKEMRDLIGLFRYDVSDDRAIMKAIEWMPGSDMIVASGKDGFNRATDAERELAHDASRPQRGHFHFVISDDGEVGFVEEAVLADGMKQSSASGVSPAVDDVEDEDPVALNEPIEAEPADVAPILEEKPFDGEVTAQVAKKIYASSRALRSIERVQMKTPNSLIETLEEFGLEIAAELGAAKGSPTHGYSRFDYLTLTEALIAGGRIRSHVDDFQRWARARDLYDASPLLQGMSEGEIWPPRVLLENLVSLKPRIVREQRALNGKELAPADLNMHGLVIALASAGRINAPQMEKMGAMFKVYDMIDRSPTLLAMPEEASSSDDGVVRYLLTHRDRIAVENLKSQGQLKPGEFIFEGAESYFSLGSLLSVLFAAGMIDDAMRNRLSSTAAGPIEYFLDNMEMVASELKRLGKGKIRGRNVNLSQFRHPRKPGETLPLPYVSHVLRWGEWFLNDPDVATRSIYRADEIAFMVLAGAGSVFEDAPREILLKIEGAGWDAPTVPVNARKQSVSALFDLLDFYEQREIAGKPVKDETREALEKVDKLMVWNRDAVRIRVKRSPGSGPSSPAAPSSPGGPEDSGLPGVVAMQGMSSSPYMSLGMGAKVILGAQALHTAVI